MVGADVHARECHQCSGERVTDRLVAPMHQRLPGSVAASEGVAKAWFEHCRETGR